MIICRYSTAEMYHEYKNGTPISEIVNKTGIKRKTWNKRFVRLEKKDETATNNIRNNNYSKSITLENSINNNGDNFASINNPKVAAGDIKAESIATANTFDSKSDACESKNAKIASLSLLAIILFLIGLILILKYILRKCKIPF
jgi:hypothetical protein